LPLQELVKAMNIYSAFMVADMRAQEHLVASAAKASPVALRLESAELVGFSL